MNSANVVIGASYGDEGKGSTIAALIKNTTAVVRFNGGAQAGHTVYHKGLRHVFSHFGAGSLHNVSTILSKHFIVNPILFNSERIKLEYLGVNPTVHVHPDAIVTTYFDMLVNQAAERSRAVHAHGSCGVGINETVTRQELISITVRDLQDGSYIKSLELIRDVWIAGRIRNLDINVDEAKILWNYVNSPNMLEIFKREVKEFLSNVVIGSGVCAKPVFEGAQGLALDEVNGMFPNVTRSRTGLSNVVDIAKDYGLKKLNVYYTTRPYLTRHGNGDLPYALKTVPEFARVQDDTNVHNEWQGSIRYGLLDFDNLADRINIDMMSVEGSGIEIVPCLSVTCMDQLIRDPLVVIDTKRVEISKDEFPKALAFYLGKEHDIEFKKVIGLSYKGGEIISTDFSND